MTRASETFSNPERFRRIGQARPEGLRQFPSRRREMEDLRCLRGFHFEPENVEVESIAYRSTSESVKSLGRDPIFFPKAIEPAQTAMLNA